MAKHGKYLRIQEWLYAIKSKQSVLDRRGYTMVQNGRYSTKWQVSRRFNPAHNDKSDKRKWIIQKELNNNGYNGYNWGTRNANC